MPMDANEKLHIEWSRAYQNIVSSALREQVLSALRALLVGFQSADRLADGAILGDYRGHMGEIYKGLVTVLMRSVFVLFAEEKNLLPIDRELYAGSYSLTRLYAQLVEDRDRHGDALEDRYGAWARMISLFRLLHDGVRAADGLVLPARRGDFFNPDAFPFLEGRRRGSSRNSGEILDLPRVSDGVVLRLLDLLLLLDGERLQYNGLDVEQVGSVYEGLMGFEIEVAQGDSLAVMPEHVVVDLEALLALCGADRLKRLKSEANLDLKDKAGAALEAATTVAALQAALGRRTSGRQPGLLPKGSLYLQPGEERRKTGSHYTPRSLTSPIVATALRPVLEHLGPDVTAGQILSLKICDPAMGSGAFLVEACRQLADHLVAAWRRAKDIPALPPDEEPLLHARRLIARQCLYGVDKNPLAVDLARLSLWLLTFAREHPFTFVDHSLRRGDSLVGLAGEQIYNLSLDPKRGHKLAEQARNSLLNAVRQTERWRREIQATGDPPDNERLDSLWQEAEGALEVVRTVGDAMVASYLAEGSDKERKRALHELTETIPRWLVTGEGGDDLHKRIDILRAGESGLEPFHWTIEFPEVFSAERGGFDVFIGNPPFLGGRNISERVGEAYSEWLVSAHEGANGAGDLVAHFFRRAFELLRPGGVLGFIATNTIAQGDTRAMGLSWICGHGGTIFAARRRLTWPGIAAVVVSTVHLVRGPLATTITPMLDGHPVPRISAFLFHTGGDDPPAILASNQGQSFVGSIALGMGFTFDDDNPNATPLAEMNVILARDPRSRERVFPYLGGEEVNTSPEQLHRRYIIDFGEMTEDEARGYPDLFAIVEARVRPERRTKDASKYPRMVNEWWKLWNARVELHRTVRDMRRVIAIARVSRTAAFTFLPSNMVYSEQLVIFAFDDDAHFAILQSRVHEEWARFLGSSMKDDLRYTPSDCFETFPFATGCATNAALSEAGRAYDEHRAALMLENKEGLTRTTNRFHDPAEQSPSILKLRELHAAMDRAVLDAHGWGTLSPEYAFREQLDESVRYTWSDEIRVEVLAHLMDENLRRSRAESVGSAPVKSMGKRAPRGP